MKNNKIKLLEHLIKEIEIVLKNVNSINEVKGVYQGKQVTLYKMSPSKLKNKKYQVYVNSGSKTDDGKIKAKKLDFGSKTERIKRHIDSNRENFRSRFKCDSAEAKNKNKKRYWNCKTWEKNTTVSSLLKKKSD